MIGTRKRILVVLSAVCFTFLTFASASLAATMYVDAANASGIEDGSAAYPFRNIQSAVDASVAGDDISVAPGIYYGHVSLKSNVRLVSQQGPEVTIVEPGGNWAGVIGPDLSESVVNCYVEGFTLRGTSIGIYAQNFASYWGPARWEVVNCIFPGFTWTGILIFPGAELVIRDSLFVNNDQALQFVYGRNGVVENNTFAHITRYALTNNYTSVSLSNNTISDVANVFYFNTNGGVFSGTNNNFWNYGNLILRKYTNGTVSLTNSLNVDPAFNDTQNGDYHLGSYSPLIDAGAFIAGREYTGSAPDIGAYEYSLTIPERVEQLAEAFYDIPDTAFKNSADNRKTAISNKFAALLNDLVTIDPNLPAEDQIAAMKQVINKLENDLMAKTDGFYGGNPKNDWITTQQEQSQVYPVLKQLAEELKQKVIDLGGTI